MNISSSITAGTTAALRGVAGWGVVALFLAASAAGEEEVRRAEMVTVRSAEVAEETGDAADDALLRAEPADENTVSPTEATTSADELVTPAPGVEQKKASAADAVEVAFSGHDEAQANLTKASPIQISLEAAVIYDSNIYLSPREEVADTLFRISPSVRIGLGDVGEKADSYVLANYRADALAFVDNSDENAVDHDAQVSGQKRFARATVGASARYQRMSGSSVDLGDRVLRDVLSGGANLTYGWGQRTSFSTAFLWDSTRFEDGRYSDFDQWTHETFATYELTGKTKVGGGFAWGMLDAAGLQDPQKFQRLLLTVDMDPAAALVVRGRAGVEWRQTDAGNDVSPVFGLDADYKLGVKTAFRLRAARAVEASGSQAGQNYTRTSLSAGVSHRLNDRITLSLDGGWENYRYTASAAGVSAGNREERSWFVRPGVSWEVAQRWRAEAWYQWRAVDSNTPDGSYDVNQAGMNLRYDF